MAIFGVVGEKGGTGKSILATNLAAMLANEGRDVLLIDTDTQRSSSLWQATRSENPTLSRVHCVSIFGKGLVKEVRELAQRYQDLVIDTGGRDTLEMRATLTCVDLALLPFQPAQFDLWTVDKMAELVTQASGINPSLEVLAVINQADTHYSSTDAKDARDFLQDYPSFQLAREPIRKRIAFKRAAQLGMGVSEYEPSTDSKASFELRALMRDIKKVVAGLAATA